MARPSLDVSCHPIERFEAPSGITAGQPLKDLFDRKLIGLIGESFAAVHPGFDRARFVQAAAAGMSDLSMMQRAAHIADALAGELPQDFPAAADVLLAALGPPLTRTQANGLQGFFYMPHCAFVSRHGEQHFEAGMAANRALTRCFTAEFSVRPFILRYPERSLALFARWAEDENPHVRRLCSEGTRPRLPWAGRLPVLQADPSLAGPLLEGLKDDPSLYVRRSVANHLGDVCKDHPEHVFALCERWLVEVADGSPERVKQRRWMVRHAVRLPAKKGVPAALALRAAAGR